MVSFSGYQAATSVPRLERDRHLTVRDSDWIAPDPQLRRGEADACRDVELDPVPRAGDDLAGADPGVSPARLGVARHRPVDAALAEWTVLVGADVRQGVECTVEIEDADFDIA